MARGCTLHSRDPEHSILTESPTGPCSPPKNLLSCVCVHIPCPLGTNYEKTCNFKANWSLHPEPFSPREDQEKRGPQGHALALWKQSSEAFFRIPPWTRGATDIWLHSNYKHLTSSRCTSSRFKVLSI